MKPEEHASRSPELRIEGYFNDWMFLHEDGVLIKRAKVLPAPTLGSGSAKGRYQHRCARPCIQLPPWHSDTQAERKPYIPGAY
jgi:hypothetical protein